MLQGCLFTSGKWQLASGNDDFFCFVFILQETPGRKYFKKQPSTGLPTEVQSETYTG